MYINVHVQYMYVCTHSEYYSDTIGYSTSVYIPAISENIRMHSLKSKDKRSSFKCCRMLTPTKRGNEQLPSNKVSQR